MNIEMYIHFWISVFTFSSRYPEAKLLDPIVILFLTSWRKSILFSTVYSSIQFSRSVVSDSLRPYGLQHTRLPCLSQAPRACSNSCPLSWWCHPTISSSAIPFSCLQSFPASESFPPSQFFPPGGQSIGASTSASVLPMNIEGWFPLQLTGLISLRSKGLLKSSPAPQFEGINSLAFSLIYGPTLTFVHDYWKNHSFDYTDLCQQSDVSAF